MDQFWPGVWPVYPSDRKSRFPFFLNSKRPLSFIGNSFFYFWNDVGWNDHFLVIISRILLFCSLPETEVTWMCNLPIAWSSMRSIYVINSIVFTWSGGPRSSGVVFFCFVPPRAWKQKKPTPLDRGPPPPCKQALSHACVNRMWTMHTYLMWKSESYEHAL